MADLIYMAKSKWLNLLDTIRAKSGISDPMTADQAIAAVEAIPSGGGGIELLASGTYTMTTTSADMYIPVSYTGTPTYAFVVNYNPTAGITQALSWSVPVLTQDQLNTVSGYFAGNDIAIGKRYYANGGTNLATVFTPTEVTSTQIHVRRIGASGYDPVPGTYNWYIWGVKT